MFERRSFEATLGASALLTVRGSRSHRQVHGLKYWCQWYRVACNRADRRARRRLLSPSSHSPCPIDKLCRRAANGTFHFRLSGQGFSRVSSIEANLGGGHTIRVHCNPSKSTPPGLLRDGAYGGAHNHQSRFQQSRGPYRNNEQPHLRFHPSVHACDRRSS
jgi:hypothetical protein